MNSAVSKNAVGPGMPRREQAAASRAPCWMGRWLQALGALMLVSTVSLVGTAWSAEDPLNGVRSQQQVANLRLARELISGVLDQQLRQLRENGLRDQPVYSEIEHMRQAVKQVAQESMQDVLMALQAYEQATDNVARQAALNRARQAARQTTVALIGQRQRLLQRLQANRLSAELNQLVTLQANVQQSVRQLLSTQRIERERRLLALMEDQLDVTAVFRSWSADLLEAAQRAGATAADASQASRLLREGAVDPLLDDIQDALHRQDLEQAATTQRQVLEVWRAVAACVEQGALPAAQWSELLQRVQAMVARQQRLIDDSAHVDWNQLSDLDTLAEGQQRLQEQLVGLQQSVAEPALQALAKEASPAALDAASAVFEGDRGRAQASQARVLDTLLRMQRWLEAALGRQHSSKSATQLAAEVQALTQLSEKLQGMQFETLPAAQLLDAIRSLQNETQAWSVLETRRLDVQRAVQERVDAGVATWQSDDVLAPAMGAWRLLQAETQGSLGDARREQFAVGIGEFARAAEALERAAAAQRQLQRESGRAAPVNLATWRLQWSQQVQRIEETLAWIEKGVQVEAPAIANQLRQARQATQDVTRVLHAGGRRDTGVDQFSNAAVAEAAGSAAELVTASIQQLRSLQQQHAQSLIRESERQAQEIAEVQRLLEGQMERLPFDQEAAARQWLLAAQQHVELSEAWQLQAAGQLAAADRLRLQRTWARMRDQWRRLNPSQATWLGAQRSAALRPLLLATQEALGWSERSWPLATPLLQDVVPALELLQRAALRADFAATAAAVRACEGAIERAQKAVESLAGQDGQSGTLDRAAQQHAEDLVRDLRRQRDRGEPGWQGNPRMLDLLRLDALLQSMADALQRATRQWPDDDIAGEPLESDLKQVQRQVLVDLSSVRALLLDALHTLDADQRRRLGEQSPSLDSLVEQASRVDAASMVAAREAALAARHIGRPEQTQQAWPTLAVQALREAQGVLELRNRRVLRDRDLAREMMRNVHVQSEARQTMHQQAEILEGAIPQDAPRPFSAAAQQAAQALQQAAQAFAEAQRQIGQGAVEVSGQREVANIPLKKGLEAASAIREAADELPDSATSPEQDSASATAGRKADSTPDPALPAASQSAPSTAAAKTATTSEMTESSARAQHPRDVPDSLGNGLIPDSPEATARRIAGREAMRQADRAAQPATQDSTGNQPTPSSPEQAASGKTQTGQQGKGADAAPTAQDGAAMSAESSARVGAAENVASGDADLDGRSTAAPLWFHRLPPALQQTLRSRTRLAAPPSYSERMRRYFEGRN